MDLYNAQVKIGIDTKDFVDGVKNVEKILKDLENNTSKAAGGTKDLDKAIDSEGKAAKESSEDTKTLGKEVKTTGNNAESASSKISDLADKIKNGLSTAAKASAAALGAASAGVVALAKDSITAFADNEQLEGGIKKLFGDAADQVLENADEAFEKAGMNVNEYMEQVSGFAAALVQATGRGEQQDIDELQNALDEEYELTKQNLQDNYDLQKEYWNDLIKQSKAAKDGEADMLTKQRDEDLKNLKRANDDKLNELKAYNKQVVAEAEKANNQSESTFESLSEAASLADVAMRAISDNVNTFGTDMSSVQAAFQGFAKQNYTMLDNLKLGYGGTKAEMERLIDDANTYAESMGQASDLTINSFADIVKAIELIQEKQGIAGTTEEEAAKTISGSVNMAKKAWQNLAVEISKDDGDIEKAFGKLETSLENVGRNIGPRVEQTLNGIGTLITAAAPKITKAVTTMLPKVLPSVISAAASLVKGVGEAVITSLPDLVDVGKDLLGTLADSISNANLGGEGIVGKLLDTITDNAGDYFEYAEKIVSGIGNAIINSDHSKLGKMFSTVITKGLNSITDLLADLDMNKVGQNIADFVKAIDWKAIATSAINLLGAALGSITDIASSFFSNMDGETFMDALAVLAAPKLLTGMLGAFKGPVCATQFTNIKDYLSQEIGSSGDAAGMTWSSAFMVGIKAFGLGWAIGTYLRDNIEIGGKTIGEWVDYAFDQTESQGDRETIEEQNKEDYGMFTAADGRQGLKYDVDSNTGLSDLFLNMAEEGKVQYESVAERVQAMQGLVNKDNEMSDFYFEPHSSTYQNQNTLNDLIDAEKQFIKDIEGEKKTTAQSQNVSYGMPQSILDMINNRYAIGGYVNEPQVAVVGESEPEYIIPESKMDDVYARNSGNVYVEKVEFIINGAFDMGSPEDRERLIEEMSSRMQTLSIAQQRALGGAGWQ